MNNGVFRIRMSNITLELRCYAALCSNHLSVLKYLVKVYHTKEPQVCGILDRERKKKIVNSNILLTREREIEGRATRNKREGLKCEQWQEMAIAVTSSLLSSLPYTENIMENNGLPRPLSLLFHTWSDQPLKTTERSKNYS